MSDILQRLPVLFNENLMQIARSRTDIMSTEKDKNGSASSMLRHELHFQAIAEYILNNDKKAFKNSLTEEGMLQLSLFDRFDAGEKISIGYVGMVSYRCLLSTLAACNFHLSYALAEKMNKRDSLTREIDGAFAYHFGRALHAFVLKDTIQMHKWAKLFHATCSTKRFGCHRGYAEMLNALILNDADKANAAMQIIVSGHKKGGLFRGTEDELLCIWGIGIANLARHYYGINVYPVGPLIPDDLLCEAPL